MYLLDTNICIYAMKGMFPKLNDRLLSIHPDKICVSSLTVGELEYGAEKSRWGSRTGQVLSLFLANFRVLPFDEDDAILFGKNRAVLALAGTPIGLIDLMIASQGVQRNLTVITHNTREFERVPGIVLEDWTD